jgi:hypothetical protein
MRHRRLVSGLLAVVLALPALALADRIGPHSSLYNQQPLSNRKPSNNVQVTVHRNTGKTLVDVANFCLGSQVISGPGAPATRYPYSASISPDLRHGTLAFNGNAAEYRGQTSPKKVRMIFSAHVTSKKVTGYAKFPGTKCGTIHFVAPLRERTN